MKTFDEYIQGRILKAYNDVPGDGIYDNFYELALAFKYDSIDNTARFMQRYGIGKQRAKDYAHYIVAWLEEQNEPAIAKSHLTDEDAQTLSELILTLNNTYSKYKYEGGQFLFPFYTANGELLDFINSLKGE